MFCWERPRNQARTELNGTILITVCADVGGNTDLNTINKITLSVRANEIIYKGFWQRNITLSGPRLLYRIQKRTRLCGKQFLSVLRENWYTFTTLIYTFFQLNKLHFLLSTFVANQLAAKVWGPFLPFNYVLCSYAGWICLKCFPLCRALTMFSI
jgi:hypothetical protein